MKTRRRGFTLLEVMVAVAILGLGLTTILSAQAGAFKNSSHARNLDMAVGLTRCKMGEVEEYLARNGFSEQDEGDTGPCCEDDSSSFITCTWKIEKPQFPEAKYGDLDLQGQQDLGALGALGQIGDGKSPLGGGGDVKLGDVAQLLTGANQSIPPPPGAGDAWNPGSDAGPAGLIQGQENNAGAGASPADMIASMAMSLIYPDLKTLFEASTRRVTVTATWKEGGQVNSMSVIQWLTNPQQGSPDEGEDGGTSTSSSTPSTSGSTSSPSGAPKGSPFPAPSPRVGH